MAGDRLLDFIKYYLDENEEPHQSEKQVIHNSVAEYMAYLMSQGNIPHLFLDQLEDDLKQEAQIIYRKLAYGYLSLKNYRAAKANKKAN